MRNLRLRVGLSLVTFAVLAACGTSPEDGAGRDKGPGTSGTGAGPSTGTGFGGILVLTGSGGQGAGTITTAGVGGVGAYDTTSAIAAGSGGNQESGSGSGGAGAGSGAGGASSGAGTTSGAGSGGASSGSGSGGASSGSGGAVSGSGGASSSSGGAQCATDADCADAYSCTIDTCDLATGTCVNTPSDAACSGSLCDPANGAPGTGCTPVGDGCSTSTDGGGGGATSGGAGGGAAAISSSATGGGAGSPATCVVTTCQGKVYACGDCIDNDGDGLTDMQDPMCVGPCDNTEDSFYGGIPGQNNAPCKADCYFDQDSGSGNDQCYWDLECDPQAPGGDVCPYDASVSLPGYGGTCADAAASQPATCGSFCGPLVPNGCDCFGCCSIPGAPTPVYLGSEVGGAGSCTLDTLNDPTKCHPCTPNPACENTCENCELCVGKSALPPECSEPSCPAGVQSCSPCGTPCPAGYSCITGCCSPNP